MTENSFQKPSWIPTYIILPVQEELLARHGGSAGIRDSGLLESALSRPRQAWAYGERDIFHLAALYAEGLCRNHPFVDGNKRIGFLAAVLFLRHDGWRLKAPEPDAVKAMLGLAEGSLDRPAIAAWLRDQSVPLDSKEM